MRSSKISDQALRNAFVGDSMTGQDAVNTAKAFNDILNFDGVITKLDGDTEGAALSIKSVVIGPLSLSVLEKKWKH